MGAQQVKERPTPSANLGVIAGSSIRSSRSKPRVPKDSRILGSNIFTEHNGESALTTSQNPIKINESFNRNPFIFQYGDSSREKKKNE